MYAEFEAILKPTEGPSPSPEESYTKVINDHIPSGFCVNSKFAYGEVGNPMKLYRGEGCVKVFCDYISNEARRLYHMFSEKPINLCIVNNGENSMEQRIAAFALKDSS